jgi:glutathione S-transferase
MTDLVVYGSPLSPFARKVEFLLRAKGLEFTYEAANIMDPPDWFLEISPARRIPVLRDRRVGAEGAAGTLPDSSAICAYLERLAPEPAFYPADAWDHGRAIWFEEWADTELASVSGMGLFRPLVFPRLGGGESDVETARRTWTEKLPGKLDYLEACLEGRDWLVGDALSIADVAVACMLGQIDLCVGPPDGDRWPRVAAHYAAVSEREELAPARAACAKMLAKALPEKIDLG